MPANSDRALWHEFDQNAERIVVEAEAVFNKINPDPARIELDALRTPSGATDMLRMVRVRRVQSFFRAAALTSYQSRCAISGLALPELLIASHILPWAVSVERRADPRNGICFNALFDRAFDRGLMTLDKDCRVVVSSRPQAAAISAPLMCSIIEAHGQRIQMPSRLAPDPARWNTTATAFFKHDVKVNSTPCQSVFPGCQAAFTRGCNGLRTTAEKRWPAAAYAITTRSVAATARAVPPR